MNNWRKVNKHQKIKKVLSNGKSFGFDVKFSLVPIIIISINNKKVTLLTKLESSNYRIIQEGKIGESEVENEPISSPNVREIRYCQNHKN